MTTSENFVSRWARLKREADIQRRVEPVGDLQPHPAAEESAGNEASIDQPFDPASLPSIESITVDTDISGFLRGGAPAELTRAALRRVWASDPAIRDFIGIAENQWDFNDPNAMPGFGPLAEGDNLRALLAQALGRRDSIAGMIPEVSLSVEQPLPAVTSSEPVALDRNARQASDAAPPADDVSRSQGASSWDAAVTSNDRVAEAENPPRRRSHGSAMPR